MADSYQKEIPKARVNITLDLETGGARKKKELPLKLLVMGDFSHGKTIGPVAERERIDINKNNFDKVFEKLSPELNLVVNNAIKNDGSELRVNLKFTKEKDLHPEEIVMQVPELRKLLAMRNLLKDLKSNIIDNKTLRAELEKLAKDQETLKNLKQDVEASARLLPENLD